MNINNQPSILIVDDEPEILIALTDLFEDNYHVFSEMNPLKALKKLEEYPEIMVIISDQRMPIMTGDKFLTKARYISDARGLLLTGYADIEAVISALNAGRIQAYANKPWNEETLLTLVGEIADNCATHRALKRQEALLKGLMDGVKGKFIFSDAQGHVIDMKDNHHFLEKYEEDYYCSDVAKEIKELRLITQKEGHAERIISHKNEGKICWHEITRWALAWPMGCPYKKAWQVCLDRDVTHRIELENRLRQTERLEAIGILASGIAHDFNNLLAIISGSLELTKDILKENKFQSEQYDYCLSHIDQAYDAVIRGRNMTRRLLQFGRLEEDLSQDISIINFFKDSAPLLKQSLKRAENCTLDIHMPKHDIELHVDPRQLEMVLLNLCINACDAMPSGGKILIKIYETSHHFPKCPQAYISGRALVIDVIDEGIGISDESQKHIFEPFFTTKDVNKGTGLGLSTVYGFMKRIYGDISFETKQGSGTVFHLFFPIKKNCKVIQDRSGTIKNIAQDIKILVMDDEVVVRRVVARFLKIEGADDVRDVSSLEHALEEIEKGFIPDLIILDVRMPKMNGPTCAQILKEKIPHLKVLFMSGDTANFPLKGERLLEKPFTQLQLHFALEEVLNRK